MGTTRRGFLKVLTAVGIAPGAVSSVGAAEGPLNGASNSSGGDIVEDVVAGMNQNFYTVLHVPTQTRINVCVPRHVEDVTGKGWNAVPTGLRRDCLTKVKHVAQLRMAGKA